MGCAARHLPTGLLALETTVMDPVTGWGLVWEKYNMKPVPMSDFALLFTEEERKK